MATKEWKSYIPYIAVNGEFQRYDSYIGNQINNVYIYTDIDIAIADIAISSYSRSGTMPLAERLPFAGEAIANISKTNTINR